MVLLEPMTGRHSMNAFAAAMRRSVRSTIDHAGDGHRMRITIAGKALFDAPAAGPERNELQVTACSLPAETRWVAASDDHERA